MKMLRLSAVALIIALPATFLMIGNARATPAFARQTGLACSACHTVFPELTPMGRRFKLGGYTLTNKPPLVQLFNDNLPAGATGQPPQKQLTLSDIPLTAFVQATTTYWAAPPPPGGVGGTYHQPAGAETQNNETLFPQQLSLAFTGAVTDHIGAWLQLTYFQQTGTFGIDTWEVRYADQTANKNWLWGVLFNNTVTMQDVYNTGGASGLPQTAFGIPYFPVPLNLAAPQAPLLLTLVATPVAGVGAYTFIYDSLYLELSGYHSAKNGSGLLDNCASSPTQGICGGAPALGAINGVSPYWRAAYEFDWGNQSFEVGTLGMYNNYVPCTTSTLGVSGCAVSSVNPALSTFSTPSQYLDFGFDTQYQFIGDAHIFTINAMYLHEDSWNNAANVGTIFSNSHNTLDHFTATASYYYERQYGGMISFGATSGSKDPIAYCAGAQPGGTAFGGAGTCNGSPNAMWETFELDYLPWLNTKIFLQYQVYNRLDSAANEFLGFSNKVSDNNFLVLGLWFAL